MIKNLVVPVFVLMGVFFLGVAFFTAPLLLQMNKKNPSNGVLSLATTEIIQILANIKNLQSMCPSLNRHTCLSDQR